MSEDFSDEEDKAIHSRNSKLKRKPRGMSNKMINEQKEPISSEDLNIKSNDSGDCPICGEVNLCLLIICQMSDIHIYIPFKIFCASWALNHACSYRKSFFFTKTCHRQTHQNY